MKRILKALRTQLRLQQNALDRWELSGRETVELTTMFRGLDRFRPA